VSITPNEGRFERYRRLTERLGGDTVRALIDRLQVLALTQPDALREFEEFLDRGQVPRERAEAARVRDSRDDR
jgi:hypothetical protein